MILRRIIEHMKAQNWTAIVLDFVIVVSGVFIGLQVNNLNEARLDRQRTSSLIDVFRTDLTDYNQVQENFAARCDKGFAAFDEARARGEKPAPYYFRITGSESAPQTVWEAAIQSNLADLIAPNLLFDIGYLYAEQQGMSVRYLRYAAFVENEILPWLDEPDHFYDEAGDLKPEYEANMMRLREWMGDNAVLVGASKCLLKRFEDPRSEGESCRPHYSAFEEKQERS